MKKIYDYVPITRNYGNATRWTNPFRAFLMALLFLLSWNVQGQYCTTTAVSNDNTGITNVTFNSIDQSSASASAYTDYTSVSTSVYEGTTYSLSVKVNTAGGFTVNTRAWIDWNNDGVFDTSTEEYNLGSANNVTNGLTSLSPVNILIPSGTASGTYIMRIRAVFGSTTTPTPCGVQNYSEAEDYTIEVLALPTCSGMPVPGIVTVTPQTGGAGTNYTVSASGYDVGTGLEYQWQSNTNGGGWVDEGTVSSSYAPYNATAPINIDDEVEWRLQITCTNGNDVATSTVTATSTYTVIDVCAWTVHVWYSGYGDETTWSLKDATNTTILSGGPYGSNFNDIKTVQAQGPLTFEISDYGSLEDNLGNFTVSNGVQTLVSGVMGDSVQTFTDLNCPVNCSGTPNVPTISLVPTVGEPSSTIYTIVSGNSDDLGTTYQWQSSPTASGPWSDIAGATTLNAPLTAESTQLDYYYRLKTTCSFSSLDSYSNEVMFTTMDLCDQGYEANDPLNIPNGLNFSGNFETANDVVVPTGESFKPQSMTFTVLTMGGTPESFHLNIYGDNGSGGVNNQVPVEFSGSFSTVNGNMYYEYLGNFGTTSYPVYTVTLDLSNVSELVSTGQDTHYWFAMTASPSSTASAVYWGVEDYTISGSSSFPTWQFDGTIWAETDDNYEGLMNVSGVCDVLPSCSGTPNTPTVTLAPALGNINSTFTGAVSGMSVGNGISYQWEKSADGVSNWMPVSGATNIPQSLTAENTVGIYYYRIVTTCANSSLSSVSTPQSFETNIIYCTPTIIDDNDATGITNVTFNSIDQSSASDPAYTDYTSVSTTVNESVTYPLSVKVNTAGTFTVNARAWIDWNNDGVFDTSTEEYDLGSANNVSNGLTSLSPVNILIPSGTAIGTYTMRIRAVFGSTTTPTPCGAQNYSEAEDYTIEVLPAPSCIAPTAVTASSITGNSAVISWTDINTAPDGWLVKYNAGGNFDPATSGTSQYGTANPATLTSLSSSTAYTYYVQTICVENSDSSAWVGPYTFTTVQIPTTLPYNQDFEGSNGFTFVNGTQVNQWAYGAAAGNTGNAIYVSNDGGTSNAYNTSSTSVTHAYRDVEIPSGATLASLSFDWRCAGESTSDRMRVWMVPESFMPVAGTQITSGSGGIQVGGNFSSQATWTTYLNSSLDISSFAGQTMRLVFEWRNDFSIGTQPPAAVDNINFAELVSCSGNPNAGTDFTKGVCAGTNFTIAGDIQTDLGLNGQWFVFNTTDNRWDTIVGATNYSYTVAGGVTEATDYRYVLECTNTNRFDTLNVAVTMNAAIDCYCTPAYSTGCNDFDDYIDNFSLNGENYSISDLNTDCSVGSYDDRRSTQTDTVDLKQGGTYSANINSGTTDDYAAVWIDFNDNGQFEANELVGVTNSDIDDTPAGTNFDIAIPDNASIGSHRMRVFMFWSGSSPDFSTIDACNNIGKAYGETHDYVVNITCRDITTNLVASTSFCEGLNMTLDAGTHAGATYVWNGDQTANASTLLVDSADVYTVQINNGGCIFNDTSAVVEYAYPMVDLGNDTSFCVGYAYTLDATNAGAGYTYDWNSGMSNDASIVVTSAGTYDVSVDYHGCITTGTVVVSDKATPVVNLGADTTYCVGDPVNYSLDATNVDATYQWNGDASLTAATLAIDTAGVYTVIVTNTVSSCVVYDTITVEEKTYLVLNLGNDVSYCEGVPFTHTFDAARPGFVSYEWNGDNTVTSSTFTADTAGIYFVEVKNALGCTGTDTIVVIENANPVVDLGADRAICAGAYDALDAGNVGVTYAWTWSTGTASGQTLIVNTVDTYSVTVTDANGCIGRDTVVITDVHPAPFVDLGNDNGYCVGTVFADALNAGNSGFTFSWNGGTASSDSTFIIDTAGTYTVVVTDANSCKGFDTIVVTEYSLPTVNLGADLAYCAGTAFNETLNAGNAGASFSWNGGTATNNGTFTATTAGTYSVKVTDAHGCISTDTVIVTENASPVVNLGIDTAFCIGTTLTLDAGNAGATYTWNGDTAFNTQTIIADTAGTYTVVVENAVNCKAYDTLAVTAVYSLPVVNLGADTTICAGTTLTLDAGNAGSTYSWNGASGAQTKDVTTANTYSVVVTNANGCSASDAIVVAVKQLPTANAISATGGSNCTFNFNVTGAANATSYAWTFGDGATATTNNATTSHSYANNGTYTVQVKVSNSCGDVTKSTTVTCDKTGVEEVALADRMILYPNPTSKNVTIEVAGDVLMNTITIIDNVGKVVYQSSMSNTSYSIDVSNLSNGLYTAVITTDNGKAMKKFEVSK